MLIQTSILLFVLLPFLAGEEPNGDFRVKNGKLARLTEFPAVVLLTSVPGPGGSVSMCTGTIIEENVIITAAHCLECGKERGIDLVIPATLSLNDGGTEYEVVEKRSHPTSVSKCQRGDKAFGENDIALVKTGKKISLDHRNTDKLSLNFDNKGGSQSLTIVGYGLDERGVSGVLKFGVVKTLANCDEMSNDKSAICYDASPSVNHQISGSGDSGCSAIDSKNTVVGINSGKRTLTSLINGRPVGEKEYGVLASVASNKDFLQGVLKGWGYGAGASSSSSAGSSAGSSSAGSSSGSNFGSGSGSTFGSGSGSNFGSGSGSTFGSGSGSNFGSGSGSTFGSGSGSNFGSGSSSGWGSQPSRFGPGSGWVQIPVHFL